MWFPDQQALAAATPGTQFVALRWHEFFDVFTPDSFQPRVCQLPTLVDEVALAADDVVRDPRFKTHLSQVQAELSRKLKGEVEAAVCTQKEIYLLGRILKSDDAVAIRDIANHLRQDGFAVEFEQRLLGDAERMIPGLLAATPVKKESAEIWLGALATLALHRGYLKRDDPLVFDNALLGRSVTEILAEIRTKLQHVVRPYDCILEVVLSPEVIGLAEEPRAAVMSQLNAVLRKVAGELPQQDLVGTSSPHRILVHRRVEATGSRTALLRFVADLQPALNLLDLYRNGPTTVSIRSGWVGPTMEALVKTEIGFGTLQKLHPRREASELTLRVLAMHETEGPLDGDITSALELYHVAMTTEDRRVRFLTLWSAMECLGHAVDGDSVMERVAKLVVPIVVWRRIEKHLRYLTISFKFARDWKPGLKAAAVPGLPNATDTKVFLEDVLESVTKPDGDLRLASLGAQAGSHSLLIWRTKVAWDTFHSPAHLKDDLLSARERLEWQVGRIYRARNGLIHRGHESPLLDHLTNNLQYYFSTTISRLLHGISGKNDRNAREAAFRWCSQSDYLMDRLANSPSDIVISDVVPAPARGHGVKLWP
jgi:hypothetical protein